MPLHTLDGDVVFGVLITVVTVTCKQGPGNKACLVGQLTEREYGVSFPKWVGP